jgi:hypothetical protein
MEYGDWKDWLSCLAVIIFCEPPSMPKRNPEGHSPRYWRRHPAPSPEESRTPTTETKPTALRFVFHYLWTWWGVGFLSAFCLAAGVNAMYSNDYIVAAALFFAGLVLLCAKCLTTTELSRSGSPRRVATLILGVGTLLFVASLVWDRHVWNKNHQNPDFAAHVTSLITNGAMTLWWLDDNALELDQFCRITTLMELYITNNQQRWTTITNLKIEAKDLGGEWRRLGIVYLGLDPKIYVGNEWTNVRKVDPTDGKYFMLQALGKNIQPGETVGGWMMMDQDLNYDIRGPLRITISDLQGDTSTIDVSDEHGLPEGGFRTGASINLSGKKLRKCHLVWE